MTNEKRKLTNIKSIVKEAYELVNENGGYYVVDVSHLIEELAIELELDETFNGEEISDLKRAGYKLSKDNKVATRKFRGIPVSVTKWEFSEYNLKFGQGRRKELEDNTGDLYDITDSTSGFFQSLLETYKEEILQK